jgi:glyoxylase-like metal-dependent hydrolase (beta-lactamase superfamily II)
MSAATEFDPAQRSPAQPLEVAERCWMIGNRNPSSLLQCNTYLRQFPGSGHGTTVCVDPGSRCDWPVIAANLSELLGDGGLDFITVNHQDPDVTGNLPALCESSPAATVVLTEDTWRLAQHLQAKPGRLQFPPALSNRVQTWREGVAWNPVPTPFCHFRGAMAFYDPESRILFSGDLFGGLNLLGRVHLFAEEADWAGIAQFHQIYMPTREVLRYAVRQIRALAPAVEVIAPQHGHVIAGDLVSLFLERMENLLVGSDLLAMELDDCYADQYGELVGMLIESARQTIGNEEALKRLRAARDDELRQCLAIVGQDWQVARSPYVCATRVFVRLCELEEPTFVEALRDQVLRFCSERGVPVPPIGWGIETGARG